MTVIKSAALASERKI